MSILSPKTSSPLFVPPPLFWFGLITLALALRVFHLDAQGLWLDEFASWRLASGTLDMAAAEATNPPFYYGLLHFWVRAFGTTEAALRSLSILPSLGVCILAWFWTSKVLHPRPAMISTAYLAISTFQIYYAQEARCYALLSFWILLASCLLWVFTTSDPLSPRRSAALLIGYTLISTLSLYTHFIASLFLASQGLFALIILWRQPRRLIQLGLAACCTIVLFSPWLVRIIANKAQSGQARRYLLLKVPQAYFSFIFGDSLIPLDEQAVQNIIQTLRDSWWILALAMISLAALALLLPRFQQRWPRPFLFLLLMAFVPVLLAFLISFKVMLFDERYLIAASPFVLILISTLIHLAWDTKARFSVVALAFLCGLSLFRYYFDPRIGKDLWRESIAWINANASSNDLILFDPDFIAYSYDYYGKLSPPPTRVPVIPGFTNPDSHIAAHSRIWLVRAYQESDQLLNTLRSSSVQTSFRFFPRGKGIEVYSFTRPSP